MKTKLFILCLSPLLLFLTSCKKDSADSIVGQWMSVAVYRIQDTGDGQWIPINGLGREFFNFSADGKFGSRTDVPGGSGSYQYDNELKELILNYEPNQYINSTSVSNLTVETITNNKLILSSFAPITNSVYKTEYSRVN